MGIPDYHTQQTTKGRVITRDQLISAGACETAIVKFQKLFGDSVQVTEARCYEYRLYFDFSYAVVILLNEYQRSQLRERGFHLYHGYETINGFDVCRACDEAWRMFAIGYNLPLSAEIQVAGG